MKPALRRFVFSSIALCLAAFASSAAFSAPPSPEMMAAMKACETENGAVVDHAKGQRPTRAQKAKLDKCLVGKGFQPPKGPPPPPPPAKGSAPPPSPLNEPPPDDPGAYD